jgi:glycosyltransferase involved in cell wall biosynthesis
VTSHGADLFGLRGKWFARMRRWVIDRASMVTLVSEAMHRRLLTDQPKAVAAVMPMGVDTRTRFFPDESVRNQGELLFVGRLVEKKGLHHLLQALPSVLAIHPEVTLSIIGFGPELERLQGTVRELALEPYVRFAGALSQKDLPGHYRRASLFVAPFIEASSGDQEGLGLVVAEAMACSCPVVVGDVPAVRDLVDEGTGVRVSAANHVALAEVINRLLGDASERAKLGLAARRHIEAHFSWDVAAERYAKLLLDLARAAQP